MVNSEHNFIDIRAWPNVEREPREAAATGSRILPDHNGCFPLAPRCGSDLFSSRFVRQVVGPDVYYREILAKNPKPVSGVNVKMGLQAIKLGLLAVVREAQSQQSQTLKIHFDRFP